ncbi:MULTISPECIES: type III secretion HpaP family protein [unclassified Achromobacter]|uniref:type III secretion HpaP family protein n=1 Tax=unclassified Achromobacter TaxID=2626865 RepID=UPI0011786688|nr:MULTISPECIES: type III secretion HpaP family protein [unclassified Achromobacter]
MTTTRPVGGAALGPGTGPGTGPASPAAYAAQALRPNPLPKASANDRADGTAARSPDKPGAERRDVRGPDNGARGRPVADPAMNEVLTKADLRAGGRDDLDYAAGIFASHYLDKDPNTAGDDGFPGNSDGSDSGAAPAVHHDARLDAQATHALRPPVPLAATLSADIVNLLTVIDKDGRRAVRMDLRHARLPKTSVMLENLPERLQVTFECGEARALDLLGKETPRLAESLALRRQRDCSVLVNTAPPQSETRYRSDVTGGHPAAPTSV